MDVVVFDCEGGGGVQVNNSSRAFLQTNGVLLHVFCTSKASNEKHMRFFCNFFACLFQFNAVSSSSAASFSLKFNKSRIPIGLDRVIAEAAS